MASVGHDDRHTPHPKHPAWSKTSRPSTKLLAWNWHLSTQRPQSSHSVSSWTATYAEEKPPDARRVDVGQEGYQAGTSVFFWKGRYYTRIEVSIEDAEAARVALALARKVAQAQPDTSE